ncbi:MAG: hypothetical protein ACOC8B_01280 [Gemmatimonadota bacterium]
MIDTTHTGRTAPRGRWLLVIPLALLAGCDNVNPTEVSNPRTTEEDLAEATEPTRALLPGLRAQFASALGATVIVTENVSDNYSIHGTALVKEIDDPYAISPSIGHVNATGGTGIYFNLQELRALADFVLDDIAPEDSTATPAQIGEAHFYRGMAYLMQAENFSAVPVEEDGPPVAASDLLGRAIDDLAAASDGAEGDIALAATGALARAYRLAGDRANATVRADDLIAADPDFVFAQSFDAQSVTNDVFFFVYQRALQEMQPLPRLDFLDPKYTTREAAIPVVKAEEMHLILAEAEMSEGQWDNGQSHLASAIELAGSRSADTEVQDDDPRANGDLSIRPRDSEIEVQADDSSPFRSGLVLDRPGPIVVPTVSSTSLDADSIIEAIDPGDEDALLHTLHLARQEILFLEGRRMSDLGIRLPIMLREIDGNPNIDAGDPGTETVIPAYIPPRDEMDRFSPESPYTGTSLDDPEDITLVETQVTIRWDMNRILAENRVSPFVGF